MRPTNLGFRSPKERTPEYYDPIVSFDGKQLNFSPSKTKSVRTSKRFMQYDIDAKRTGYRVGPGTYNLPKPHIKGGALMRPFSAGRDVSNNAYYYVGDHLVYESAFEKKKKSRATSRRGSTKHTTSTSFYRKETPRVTDTQWYLSNANVTESPVKERPEMSPEKVSNSKPRNKVRSPYLAQIVAGMPSPGKKAYKSPIKNT